MAYDLGVSGSSRGCSIFWGFFSETGFPALAIYLWRFLSVHERRQNILFATEYFSVNYTSRIITAPGNRKHRVACRIQRHTDLRAYLMDFVVVKTSSRDTNGPPASPTGQALSDGGRMIMKDPGKTNVTQVRSQGTSTASATEQACGPPS